MRGQHHVPAALPSGKRYGTNFIGGWVGPRAGLDVCGKSRPHRDWIPGLSYPDAQNAGVCIVQRDQWMRIAQEAKAHVGL